MKVSKPTETISWSLKDIAKAYNMSESNLRYRCRKVHINPVNHEGKFEYRLNAIDIDRIMSYERKNLDLPQIIYIQTTWYILESKMNFEI